MENSGIESNTALASSSLVTSILAGCLTHPIDTVKTCLQSDLEKIKYKDFRTTCKIIYKTNIFRGIGWRIGQVTTTIFLVNKFREILDW